MRTQRLAILAVLMAVCVSLTACAPANRGEGPRAEANPESPRQNTRGYITIVGDNTDMVDPQRTSGNYTVALNVMDRLVEVETREDGTSAIVPSLAERWEISGDGRVYTFHLRENVRFSNGSPLTASDV